MVGSVIDFAVPLYRRILGTEGSATISNSSDQVKHIWSSFLGWLSNDNCSDAIEKTAESTAEALEKIAKIAEEVSSDVAGGLPDGARLKKAALQMEEICEIVDQDSVKAEAFIQKVLELLFHMKDLISSRYLLDMDLLASI